MIKHILFNVVALIVMFTAAAIAVVSAAQLEQDPVPWVLWFRIFGGLGAAFLCHKAIELHNEQS